MNPHLPLPFGSKYSPTGEAHQREKHCKDNTFLFMCNKNTRYFLFNCPINLMHKYTKQVFYAARRNMERKVICLFFSREMPDLGVRSASSLIEKCQFSKSIGFNWYFSASGRNEYLCNASYLTMFFSSPLIFIAFK